MPLVIILIAITLSSTFVASLVTGYTRETSGVFERWNNHSPAANQALFDAANQIALEPSISSSNDPTLASGEDSDGDGLSNGDESGRELDPRNPDTDGDGTSDGTETTLGTDPLDPTSGGLGPAGGAIPILPSGQLILDNINKTIAGEHLVEAPIGSEVTFTITAQAYLRGNISKTLAFEDLLPSGLRFKSGTIIFNGALEELSGWNGRRLFELNTAGSYSLVASLTTEVVSSGTITNIARIFDANNPNNQLDARAYVQGHAPSQPPPPPPPLATFTKTGRTAGGDWHGVVFAEPADTVEFRILVDTTQTNLTLKDELPLGLEYVENSLTMSFNNQAPQPAPPTNFFDSGLALNTAGQYEFRFFATVDTVDRFILSNRAKISGLTTGLRSAFATVINRPI